MKEFQNRNPLRCQGADIGTGNVAVERSKPIPNPSRNIISNILFLLVLLVVLGGIVWHYSRFSTHGQFVLLTEESNIIADTGGQIEYQRLMVRNRFPFVLMVAARLCRIEGDATSPRFTVLDTQYASFPGTRSWYSGTFETRVTFVTSDNGRFTETDQSGEPLELLKMPLSDTGFLNQEARNESTMLPLPLATPLAKKLRAEQKLTGISEIKEDRKVYGKDIIWHCSLPGGHTDKVLVIILTPLANYGR